MKKIIFGAVAAMISLAACETIQPIEEPVERPQDGVSVGTSSSASQVVSDSIEFTATLGIQSKTYLEYDGYGYKTLWETGDRILIWDANSYSEDNSSDAVYEFCYLKSGAGTTEATFAGTLETESYVALYADDYTYPINGNPAIILPSTQQSYFRDEENNIAPYVWPMIAISDSKEFQFQNLCSILKVSLTGSGETLTQINVESKSGNEYLAGYFYVKSLDDTNMLEPYYSVSTVINYRCNLTLSSDPVDCYIVVPAQYYSEGLSFTICTDRGNMEVSSGKLTTYRSRFYDIPVDVEPVPMPDGVYLEPRYSKLLTPSTASDYALVETSDGVYEKFITLESSATEGYTIVKWEDGVKTQYAGYDYLDSDYNYTGYSYRWFSVVPYEESQWYIHVEESNMYHVHLDFNNSLLNLLPANWVIRGTCNNWDATLMEVETFSSDYIKYAARGIVFNSSTPMYKFDHSWSWSVNGIITNLGLDESSLTFNGPNIQLDGYGVYDIELEWSLTSGLLDGFSYNATKVGEATLLDYSNCQLELVGPSIYGEQETVWNWGNVQLADNNGCPYCDGKTYTWTWWAYLYNEYDTVSIFPEATPGFKIRTLNYAESGGIPNFDLGYTQVVDSSVDVSSIDSNNILVSQSGWYTIICTLDMVTGSFAIKIQ